MTAHRKPVAAGLAAAERDYAPRHGLASSSLDMDLDPVSGWRFKRAPSTAEIAAGEETMPSECASCGSTRQVRPYARCGGVVFCSECREQAATPIPYDEMGSGD